MVWSEDRTKLLLAFSIFDENILSLLVDRIKAQDLYFEFHPQAAIIFSALKSFLNEYDEMPKSFEVLKPSIIEDSKNFMEIGEKGSVLNTTLDWAKEIFSIPLEVLKGHNKVAKSMAYKFITEYHIKPVIKNKCDEIDDPARFREYLSGLSREYSSLFTDEGPKEVYPLSQPENLIHGLKVTTVGVPIWDRLFGGLRHSELYLLLGPTGGGKSSLSIQLGANVADHARVYYATYEEQACILSDPENPDGPKRSEFTIRALGALAGISRNDLQRNDRGIFSFDDLDPNTKQKILDFKEKDVAKNFRVVDYVNASPVNSSLTALMDNIREAHEQAPLGLVIIDPFWVLVNRTSSLLGVSAEPSARRAQAQVMAEHISSFASELSVPIVVVHQVGASAGEKRRKRPTVYASAEIKTLAWRFENVAIITPQSPGGECSICRGKSRYAGEMNQAIRAKFHGDKSRFELVEADRIRGSFDPMSEIIDESGSKTLINSAPQIAKALVDSEEDNA